IAPMVAARNPDIAFIVLLAGTGVPGEDVIVQQVIAANEAAGVSKEVSEKNGAMERQVLDIVQKVKENASMETDLKAKFPGPDTSALGSPWYRYFLAFDPATALRKVKCPVLALNGEKDVQV